MRLRSDVDDQPVAMEVRLWRLALPEDEAWTAGDELSRTLDVATEGANVDRLPPGRYRFRCADLRDGAADPPEFTLTAGVNDRDVVVGDRRWFRLRLLVVDEAGRAIRGSIERRTGFHATGFSGDEPPDWAQPRRRKSDPEPRRGFSGLATGCGMGGDVSAVDSDAAGFFDLDRHQERPRGEAYRRWNDSYTAPSRTRVVVHADDDIGDDSTFVGVATRIEVLVAHVTAPDGSRLDPATAKIEATCSAMRCAWTPPADAWRTAPVHVTITMSGFETLKFVWTAATADEEHRLVASPPKRR